MMAVVGRFAPSPTGPLHFGSLLAAMASYLSVRQKNGQWLVRIEDVDRFRIQDGATNAILSSLEWHGFEWDGPVHYQTQRDDQYQAAIAKLKQHTFPCSCSRKALLAERVENSPLIYPGHCRQKTWTKDWQGSVRLRVADRTVRFEDAIYGPYEQNLATEVGDFILRRGDGLFAYQLAVVVDDAEQGITEVVRGADLLNNTPRQILLQQLLGYEQPDYAHIPLALNPHGQKLSKQHHAMALNNTQALDTLCAAFAALGQRSANAVDFDSTQDFWRFATEHWQMSKVPQSINQHFA